MLPQIAGFALRQVALPAVLIVIGLAATGCGQSTKLELTEKLTVAMQGTFEAPVDAVGNAEPKFVKFTLTGVSMTGLDGTVTDIYKSDPLAVRIISRPQIIHEVEVKDYVGETFTQLTVTFDSAIEAGGKYEESMPLTLTTPNADYLGSIAVEKAKAMRLDISVQWKDTVTRDDDAKTETMTSPALLMDLTSK